MPGLTAGLFFAPGAAGLTGARAGTKFSGKDNVPGGSMRFARVLVATCGLLASSATLAAALPSRPREAPERPAPALIDLGASSRQRVASVLQALGLPPAQVEERLSRLSRRDLEHLAEHPDQIRTGGTTGAPVATR